jgi:hypothetical protein
MCCGDQRLAAVLCSQSISVVTYGSLAPCWSEEGSFNPTCRVSRVGKVRWWQSTAGSG